MAGRDGISADCSIDETSNEFAVMNDSPRPIQPEPDNIEQTSSPQRRWRSEDLFGEEREILILHQDQVYRLRRTRGEKLILQK